MNEGLEKELRNLQKESFQRFERLRSELLLKNDEVGSLRERREVLLEENEEWRPRFRFLEAEQKSVANTDLEALSRAELQKKKRQEAAWRAVTAMAGRTAARLCKKGRDGGDEDEEEMAAVDETVRKMVQPFAEALKTIERSVEGREEEMKESRRRIEKAVRWILWMLELFLALMGVKLGLITLIIPC